MTGTPYRVTIDRDRSFVRIDLFGFWTVETARGFIGDYARSIEAGAAATQGVLLLLDQQALEVQSAEVAQMLASMAETCQPLPRKVAVISNKAMVRMQGKRMQPASLNAWFDSETDAMAWLFSDQPMATPQ